MERAWTAESALWRDGLERANRADTEGQLGSRAQCTRRSGEQRVGEWDGTEYSAARKGNNKKRRKNA